MRPILSAVFVALAPVVCRAAESGVFRFWWNEDEADDGQVNGVADRENFFPLLLDIGTFVNAWRGDGVSFRLRGNGAVNVVWTDMPRADVWALYRSDEVKAGEDFDLGLDDAPVVSITTDGLEIPRGVIARIRGGHDVVMACEVRPGARAGVVSFEAAVGGQVVFRAPMGCAASAVAGKSDYHLSASNAFDVAASLAASVNAFAGRKVVIAHSLGTMLAANAIQFFGMEADKVIFLNAAIPSEALDPDRFDASPSNPLVHDAWRDYPAGCWTSLYHALDTSGTHRARLTWRGRFPSVAPLLFNMYSSGDEVLGLYPGDGNPGWSDGLWSSGTLGARYAWQKQELWKGRAAWHAGVGTTAWSGWGFKAGAFGRRAWSAAEANAVTDPRAFATNTVFNPFPASVTNAVLSEAEVSAHLTQGIPALSPALGNVAVFDGDAGSMDMNVDDDQQRPNDWPNDFRDFGRAWLHSDIKDIPNFFTYPKFDVMVEKGVMK